MVGDKEIHNDCSKRKLVESHTHESSPEIVPECVGRKSTIIPGGKRQVQPLISEVAKKMRMSSNLAKRKRPEDEPAHPEDDWHDEVYSNTSSFVQFDHFGQVMNAIFRKGPVSPVLQGGHIASNSNILSKIQRQIWALGRNLSDPPPLKMGLYNRLGCNLRPINSIGPTFPPQTPSPLVSAKGPIFCEPPLKVTKQYKYYI